MTNTQFQLVWGCDPDRQFETSWLRYLFTDLISTELYLFKDVPSYPLVSTLPTILVETGLLFLTNHHSNQNVKQLLSERFKRLNYLKSSTNTIIIHLSDEEGFDADIWYPMLPGIKCIWRNFHHSRLKCFNHRIHSFPIGPRTDFLNSIDKSVRLLSSSRVYPWSFMGTIWKSGSRHKAVSLFLHALPSGYYFGGSHFGQGLPQDEYYLILSNSKFCLTPEGDRHLDTFRLWESLSAGCMPLIVDHNLEAKHLLPFDFPLPIFSDWQEALTFSQFYLSNPDLLNRLQEKVFDWWIYYISRLKSSLLF